MKIEPQQMTKGKFDEVESYVEKEIIKCHQKGREKLPIWLENMSQLVAHINHLNATE